VDPIYLSITLFLVGITLAFLDLFIPSGATLLVMGIIATIASILFAFRVSSTFGMLMLTLSLSALPASLFVAVKVWPRTYVGKRVILPPPQPNPEVSETNDSATFPVGEVIKLDAPLLPSGAIRLNNQIYNLVAQSGAIEAQTHVEVIEQRGREFVVKPTDAPLTSSRVPRPAERGALSEPEGLLDLAAEDLGLDSIDEDDS
jgi:membrane-bound ClpP family serine protease